MSGHSKWSNIKRKKAFNDSKKSKLFTKLVKDVTLAVKIGDKNVKFNSKLKTAVDKALSSNISKSVINKAIGNISMNTAVEYFYYSGFWLYGIAFIINCSVDNKNKVASELRCIFSKYNGSLVHFNSVSHLFRKCIKIFFDCDILLMSDFVNKNKHLLNVYNVIYFTNGFYIGFDDYNNIKNVLDDTGIAYKCNVVMIANNFISLSESELETVLSLTNSLKKLDYVKDVFSNVKF